MYKCIVNMTALLANIHLLNKGSFIASILIHPAKLHASSSHSVHIYTGYFCAHCTCKHVLVSSDIEVLCNTLFEIVLYYANGWLMCNDFFCAIKCFI